MERDLIEYWMRDPVTQWFIKEMEQERKVAGKTLMNDDWDTVRRAQGAVSVLDRLLGKCA